MLHAAPVWALGHQSALSALQGSPSGKRAKPAEPSPPAQQPQEQPAAAEQGKATDNNVSAMLEQLTCAICQVGEEGDAAEEHGPCSTDSNLCCTPLFF